MHINEGEVNNLCWLAYMYYKGLGVEIDVDKAISLYEKGLKHKKTVAYSNLGAIYKSETLGRKNIKKSIYYYTKGAEAGDKYALNGLGNIYMEGDIIEQDVAKAVELFKKAAKQNFMYSQFSLAEIYEKGKGDIKMNLEEAIKLYQAAAKQGHEEAKKALKRLNAE
jgi:TPR repeat protein